MATVTTFSRKFPAYHPRKGQSTHFVEKILNVVLKNSTFASNLKFWDLNYYCLLVELNKKSIEEGKLTEAQLHSFQQSLFIDGSTPEKHTTIRAGHRWKAGDKFSPRVWSGKPYNSPQIIIAPDIEVVKTYDFLIAKSRIGSMGIWVDHYMAHDDIGSEFHVRSLDEIAKNDGLSKKDLLDWFRFPKPFSGQIICWSSTVNY